MKTEAFVWPWRGLLSKYAERNTMSLDEVLGMQCEGTGLNVVVDAG